MVLPLGRPWPSHVKLGRGPSWTSHFQIIQNADVLDLLHKLCSYSTLPFHEHCTTHPTPASIWCRMCFPYIPAEILQMGTPQLTLWLRTMRFQTDPLFLYFTFIPSTKIKVRDIWVTTMKQEKTLLSPLDSMLSLIQNQTKRTDDSVVLWGRACKMKP